ncbi:MAG: hypothetical protein J5548_08380 [Prevotella sp.]|nr:hypothetical protein [Prevotella sp.]
MSRWETIKTLRRHNSLSEKRHPAFAQNKVGKVFAYIMVGFTILYLMFLSVPLALAANGQHQYTASELMFGFLPFILAVDFYFRFIVQQTPSQAIKPYVLLPLGKYTCIDSFLFNSATSVGNLIWQALFIPYAIMSILFVEGFWNTLGFILAYQLCISANSMWYMLARTLVNRKYYWWFLILLVTALLFSPWYLGPNADFQHLCETYAAIGQGATRWSPMVFGGILLVIALLTIINRRVQYDSVYAELSKTETTKIKHVSQLKQLERFGEVGEYLKLEVKSIMRNKNIRKGFISANILILCFSLAISFTDVYGGGMTKFLVVYNFAIYGAMLLVKVMCYEGNYIDCLMVHKENILQLLKAKYFLYSILLLLPMLLMLPTVFMGKCSLMMLIAIMLVVAGPVHACFLYMAVINKQTIPLNTKFIGKGGMETNFLQVVVEFAAFLLPLLLLNLLPFLFGQTGSAIALMVLGLAVIFTYRIWIRDIYRRMMKRRYENMEGFHATRA